MKISFLNGRHIVEDNISSLKEFWGDHKSCILKAHRTVLLLDCPFVAHLSSDNLSRGLSLTLRPHALLSEKPDKCSIWGLWTSCPCTQPREDSSSTHCLITDCYLQRHCYRRKNTCLYFVRFKVGDRCYFRALQHYECRSSHPFLVSLQHFLSEVWSGWKKARLRLPDSPLFWVMRTPYCI